MPSIATNPTPWMVLALAGSRGRKVINAVNGMKRDPNTTDPGAKTTLPDALGNLVGNILADTLAV